MPVSGLSSSAADVCVLPAVPSRSTMECRARFWSGWSICTSGSLGWHEAVCFVFFFSFFFSFFPPPSGFACRKDLGHHFLFCPLFLPRLIGGIDWSRSLPGAPKDRADRRRDIAARPVARGKDAMASRMVVLLYSVHSTPYCYLSYLASFRKRTSQSPIPSVLPPAFISIPLLADVLGSAEARRRSQGKK